MVYVAVVFTPRQLYARFTLICLYIVDACHLPIIDMLYYTHVYCIHYTYTRYTNNNILYIGLVSAVLQQGGHTGQTGGVHVRY